MSVGEGENLLLIAGPCQIESLEHCIFVAESLMGQLNGTGVNLVFKASFDKANRTSIGSRRGPGIDEGLAVLARVKEETGLPILTDIHHPEQACRAAEVADVIQIPAFLCRQTDLLVAAGKTGKAVHIKKGQFMHPEDMRYAAEKVASTGNEKVILCERGTTHGYRDLVVDMRGLVIMKETGYPVIFDATHSVQLLGGAGGSSGGVRKYSEPLAKAAVAVGVDGIFIECHENPSLAPSDGDIMFQLEGVGELVRQLLAIRRSLAR
ncbi:MAG: 3-deoxy-8-phosphooctulonate synthase [Candidatus Dadabacteria bacterium]|nr:MAG: 3-deoxy-8-phosphooctulonate synthase [Candidatus Dadabacteria bacterium]